MTEDKLSSGVAGLDDILHGGFPRRYMMLISGQPGTGKTTLALQCMAKAAQRGEKALFLSVAQTSNQLRMIASAHGIDLDDMVIESIDPAADSPRQSHSVDTRETMLRALLSAVEEAIERVRPDVVVFDSLLELRLLSPDENVYRRELLSLRRMLGRYEATSLVLSHLGYEAQDAQVEGIAHGVVRLECGVPPVGVMQRRLTVTKMRGVAFSEGFHDFRIETGGLRVFPRVIPIQAGDVPIGPALASGCAGLDDLLRGGLEYGTICLLVGQSGTGKSTLSSLFASAAAAQAVPSALYLFEERPEIFRQRSEGLGIDLEGEDTPLVPIMEHFDPVQVSAGEFSRTVLSAVEKHGVRLVVIDSLTGYLRALPEQSSAITHLRSLLQFLARRGILVIATLNQQGLMGEDPQTDLDASYLADTIILLRQHEEATTIRRSLAVLKKRHGQHTPEVQELILKDGGIEVRAFPGEARPNIGPETARS